jgi:NADH-quinone oxidoreductase subunit H
MADPERTAAQMAASDANNPPRTSLGQLAGNLVLALVGLVVLGLVLGAIWGVGHSQWLTQDPTLSGFVRLYLTDDPTLAAAIVALVAWLIVIFGFMLPMVTYQIYALRKVMGFMQARLGPTQVGPIGLLQTPADVVKLLAKEDVIPAKADRWVFLVAPFLVLVPASMTYLVVPFGNQSLRPDGQVSYSLVAGDLNIGVLYLAAISSIAVIGIIAAGWASNNKYALLGAMRSAAQLVTYEVPLSLALLAPVLWAGTLNLSRLAAGQDTLAHWYLWPCLPAAVIFVVAALAELGHTPFDLPEAESELVSGYNTEYSGMKFAMFFLAEFSNAFIQSAVFVTLFLGGWHSPFPGWLPDHGLFAIFWFFLKTFTAVFVLFWIRATLPRLRIDQLMSLGWKFLVPAALLDLVYVAVLRVLCPS